LMLSGKALSLPRGGGYSNVISPPPFALEKCGESACEGLPVKVILIGTKHYLYGARFSVERFVVVDPIVHREVKPLCAAQLNFENPNISRVMVNATKDLELFSSAEFLEEAI
jgi:hypothetical protein